MAAEHGIPNIEKRVVLTALLFAGAMLVLLAFAALRLGITVPTCVTNVQPFSEGELIEVGPGRYEAHVVAKQWEFEPSSMKVPRGAIVDFYITSPDVVHGFVIEGTDINLMAIPGAVTYAQARFDAPGKRQIRCHEFCGTMHDDMFDEIEVTP